MTDGQISDWQMADGKRTDKIEVAKWQRDGKQMTIAKHDSIDWRDEQDWKEKRRRITDGYTERWVGLEPAPTGRPSIIDNPRIYSIDSPPR